MLTAANRGQRHDLARLLEALAPDLAKHGLRVDWDPGAGEDWAQVMDGKRFVGIIWRRGPLAIVLSELPPAALSSIQDNGVELISVHSFDDPAFQLDASAVPVLRGSAPWPEGVSLDAMSIQDLWWATV
jgi:hypothetical protein